MANIVVIEDDATIASNVLSILQKTQKNSVKHYFTAEEALNNALTDIPEIVLMDIELPGINGIEATKKYKLLQPSVDIIMISIIDDADRVFKSLQAGAVGYITKNNLSSSIENAINECLDGGAPMSAKIARMVTSSFNQNSKSPLSYRETEVIKLLSDAKTYTQIANELFIAPSTVKTHIKNIYSKLFSTTKAEAIKAAKNQHLI
jgi:DNA-binding NarL/FixJ family response regulator